MKFLEFLSEYMFINTQSLTWLNVKEYYLVKWIILKEEQTKEADSTNAEIEYMSGNSFSSIYVLCSRNNNTIIIMKNEFYCYWCFESRYEEEGDDVKHD